MPSPTPANSGRWARSNRRTGRRKRFVPHRCHHRLDAKRPPPDADAHGLADLLFRMLRHQQQDPDKLPCSLVARAILQLPTQQGEVLAPRVSLETAGPGPNSPVSAPKSADNAGAPARTVPGRSSARCTATHWCSQEISTRSTNPLSTQGWYAQRTGTEYRCPSNCINDSLSTMLDRSWQAGNASDREAPTGRASPPPTTSGSFAPPHPSDPVRPGSPGQFRVERVQILDLRQRREEGPLRPLHEFSTWPFSFPLATLQNRLSNRYQLRSSRNRRFKRRSRPRPT